MRTDDDKKTVKTEADLDQEVGVPSSEDTTAPVAPAAPQTQKKKADAKADEADLDQEVGVPSSEGTTS